MLYLIGLGLNSQGISKQGLDAVKKCKKVYLENYTVDFPYSQEELEDVIKKKIIPADRNFTEGLGIVDEATKMDVALLVYGSPLTATTHISIIQEAKNCNVKCNVIHSASVLDSVSETGLQIYKFGKTASMPKWNKEKNFTPDSFIEVIKENQSIKAHSLILIDIGLEFQDALSQLQKSAEKHGIKLNKIIVCQALGTKESRISYKTPEELKEFQNVRKPYCMIIHGKLHFMEKQMLESL